MKHLKTIYTGLALSALFLLAVTACKKEAAVIDDSAQYQESVLIDDADNNYNSTTFTTGDETTAFSAENEGLPEVYTLIETDMDDAGFKRGIEKRILVCLKKLDLSDTQIRKLRASVHAYELCKANDIKLHREAYAKLHLRIENARQEYLAQLKAGKITKAEFEAKMKGLRAEFETGLKYIKASFAKNLRACYEHFVRSLKYILNDRQWKAFVDCYR